MKNAYKKFAYYYDEVIQETNYDLWVEFVEPYLKKDDKILDLACGTGTFVTMLKLNGYENVSGLDLSDEIIEIANEKRKINRLDINFYVEDMMFFKVSEKQDVITCFFDSVNFLKDKNEIKKLFNAVYNALKPNGYFIFDVFSKEMLKEYTNNKYEKDFETFKINWITKKINSSTLKHEIEINEDGELINESYYEYYHPLNELMDSRFNLEKLSGDFNDDLEDEDERIIIIYRKK